MCTGVEIAALAGAALSAGSAVYQGKMKQELADEEAANLRDQAQAEAEQVRRATQRRVSSARAATAASGTELDDFSMINTNEIQQLGSEDAAMTILTGERRGRTREFEGDLAYQSAKFDAIGGLMSSGARTYAGWKNRRS